MNSIRRLFWQLILFVVCALASWSALLVALAFPHDYLTVSACFVFGAAAYVAASFWLQIQSVLATATSTMLLAILPLVIGSAFTVDHRSMEAQAGTNFIGGLMELPAGLWLSLPVALALHFALARRYGERKSV